MPKIVDHEARRQVLSEAVWRVIARDGIDGVTMRKIADEAGCSTGTLAHYFADKDAILRSALERADENVRARIASMPPELDPLDALVGVLSEALPLDDDRAFELTLDVNFWARALNQPALRSVQHHDHDTWRAKVIDAVTAAREPAGFSPGLASEDIADVLVAFVDGIGLQALIYPELLTRRRVAHLLSVQIDLLKDHTA